jgi:tetratricopeptide (TPR) repeat protein
MSSLSSIPGAKSRPHAAHADAPARPAPQLGRSRTVITSVLLLIWTALMGFAAVSVWNPPWLQRIGQTGKEAESRAYLHYGDSAVRRANYPLAISQYLRSLAIMPDQPATMTNLAATYIKIGDADHAMEILNRVEKMDLAPRGRASVYFNLAEAYELRKAPASAIAYCRRALEYGAEPDRVNRKLGKLYIVTEQYAAARAALEQTLAAQRDVTLPYVKMLGRAIDEFAGDPVRSAELQQQLTAGVHVEDLGQFDLTIMRDVQAHDPDISRTLDWLGGTCAKLGDLAAARQHVEEALRIWPENPEARANVKNLTDATPKR